MRRLLLFSMAVMLLVGCAKEIEQPDVVVPSTKSGKQMLTLTFYTQTYQPSVIMNYGLQFHCDPDVWKVDLEVRNVFMFWSGPFYSPTYDTYGVGVQMFNGLFSWSEIVPCAVDEHSFVDLGSIRVNDATVAETADLYDFNVLGIPSRYYDPTGSGGGNPIPKCPTCLYPLAGGGDCPICHPMIDDSTSLGF